MNFNEAPSIKNFLIADNLLIESYDGVLPFKYNCTICSTSKELKDINIDDPYEFISEKFIEMGVYIPDLVWISDESHKLIHSFHSPLIEAQNFNEIVFFRVN